MRSMWWAFGWLLILGGVPSQPIWAVTYEVGPGRALEAIGDVPWEALAAGDSVRVFWREEPYREEWVICRAGTVEKPIVVSGVPNSEGLLPVIDGRDATTRSALNFWNEPRGVIKIGGANAPVDTLPGYIVVENLDIRSGRPPYTFTGRDGVTEYVRNCAAIFLEKGEHITIRSCILRDCGNGLFASHDAHDVLVEGCYIYDNGIEGRIYEHNNYTEAFGIVFQYNRFGPLRKGCLGNNLKDRSAGTVIRYNWIEGGNRQLDLVDSGSEAFIADASYRSTFVYGNVLVEFEDFGNSQICHYGGDSGDLSRYRKGTLHFYHNTVISTRSGNTTVLRLSSNEESCDFRNNLVYVTEPGSRLALSNSAGTIDLRHNWLKSGWVQGRGDLTGSVRDLEGNLTGGDPGLEDFENRKFELRASSPCVDKGTDLAPGAGDHPALREYQPDRQGRPRPVEGKPDLGAYEYATARADFDGNGRIDFADFLLFALAYGHRAGDAGWRAAYDLNGDGEIGFGDFVIFAGVYGREVAGGGRPLRLLDLAVRLR